LCLERLKLSGRERLAASFHTPLWHL
jgi:hypothetical protein